MATQEHDLLKNLIHYLSRLPGLGPRSGRRIAFYLLKNQHHVLQPLIQILTNINHTISCCHQCGMVDVQSPCVICKDLTRDIPMIGICTTIIMPCYVYSSIITLLSSATGSYPYNRPWSHQPCCINILGHTLKILSTSTTTIRDIDTL